MSIKTLSEVPSIYLKTGKNETSVPISKLKKSHGYLVCTFKMKDKDGNNLTEDFIDVSVKVRGNTTAKAEKKSYTIKFTEKQNLLGFGEEKKYCLIANAYDPTLMRNYIAFKFAEEMGLAYTSKCEFVDLYIDDEYWGNYLLVEPIEAGTNRVDIDTSKGEFIVEYEKDRVDVKDVTREYVGKYGNLLPGDLTRLDPFTPGIQKSSGGTIYIELDDSNFRFILSDYNSNGEEFQVARNVRDVLQNVKDTITKKDMTIEELEKVIDAPSFAKLYLLDEYLKVVDVGYSSVYFYYKNNKLYAGPVWDYDLSMGNCGAYYTRPISNYNNCERSQYDPSSLKSTEGFWAQENFFGLLMNNHNFSHMVMNLYKDKRRLIQTIYEHGGWIDQITETYKCTFEKNYAEKWLVRDESNSGNIEGECGKVGMRYADETYKENVEFLREWLVCRDKWMSSVFDTTR